MMVCVLYTGQYTDCGSYRTSEASDFSILVSILVVDHIGTSEASDYFFYTTGRCWRRFISHSSRKDPHLELRYSEYDVTKIPKRVGIWRPQPNKGGGYRVVKKR